MILGGPVVWILLGLLMLFLVCIFCFYPRLPHFQRDVQQIAPSGNSAEVVLGVVAPAWENGDVCLQGIGYARSQQEEQTNAENAADAAARQA
mmetsp:Transcript_72352/g.130206  ORF Transcript_72352/g.130206 Transcript_72352/m.130206 type:complete len:92 (+) Transcript_72352:155-430(+)